MQKLADILTALRQYIKQYHLLANGYENHLLAERLDEGMSESLEASIDRLKELALGMGGPEADTIAYAENSLSGALEELKIDINPSELTTTETDKVLMNIGTFIKRYLEQAEAYSATLTGTIFKGSIDNAIFGIGEDMVRRAYLLNIQLNK